MSALLLRTPTGEHGSFVVKRTCRKEKKKSNFATEKPDRYYVSQVTEVSIKGYGSCR